MMSYTFNKESGEVDAHDKHLQPPDSEELPPVLERGFLSEARVQSEIPCLSHEPNEVTLESMLELGKKYDSGKLDWTLVPFSSLEGAVRVLMFGAEKYGRFNWELVKEGEQRYTAALLRHLFSYISGEKTDPETGMCHMSHVLVNAIFVEALRRKNAAP